MELFLIPHIPPQKSYKQIFYIFWFVFNYFSTIYQQVESQKIFYKYLVINSLKIIILFWEEEW
jgi:hypothetical protein